jgi:hypothetical protein
MIQAVEGAWAGAERLYSEAIALADRVALEPAEAHAIRIQATIALESSQLRRRLGDGEPARPVVAEMLARLEAKHDLARHSGRRG